MSRSTRRTPDEIKVRRVNAKEKPVDWTVLLDDEDLTDVPDLFPHEAFTSPVNDGDFYRAECDECGTVLRVFITEAEAQAYCDQHVSREQFEAENAQRVVAS